MRYTAVIRTLGRAGEKYQRLLDSLLAQTMKPEAIIVYIADGYELPAETAGVERYVRVKKGMVAQRALQYEEVKSDYILFLDDDVYLPAGAVAKLFEEMEECHGDVIAPSLFPNHLAPLRTKLRLSLLGKEVCRPFRSRMGYKVLRSTGFSYNNNPSRAVYPSQTNGGPCFLCRKDDFLRIKLDEELWLDSAPYALPEDQTMFYKMHLMGLRQLTSFDSGIEHLDAGTATAPTADRLARLVYSEYRNKTIFWHRFIYTPSGAGGKLLSLAAVAATFALHGANAIVKRLRGREEGRAFFRGLRDGIAFVKSAEYKKLPKIARP